MKKVLVFVAMFAIITMAAQKSFGQTGVQIKVYPQLIAGMLYGNEQLCYGDNALEIIETDSTIGGQGTYTYQWQESTDLGAYWTIISGATGRNYDPGSITTTTWYRRIDKDSMCGQDTTNTIEIDVYGEFLAGITTGGNDNICNGDDGGTLTAPASTGGAPGTTYQWEIWNDTLWTPIIGEEGLTYAVGSLTETSSFRIAYMNPSCGTLYGNIITLNVYDVFVEGTVTGGNTPICYNTNAGILTGTAATGGAPTTTMHWERSTDGVTYTAIVGQTTLTLVLGNLSTTMWYRLRYDNLSCGTAYSNVINIVVYNQFIAGSISFVGINPSCYNTDPGMFTGVAPTGGDPTTIYQWQTSTNGTIWTNIAGETGLDYDLPVMTTPNNYFRRIDTNGCGVLHTNTIQITIYPIFNPGIVGVDQSICFGDTPNTLVFETLPSGGDGNYTYQWEQSTDGGLVDPYTEIPGETDNTYQPPSLTSGIWYNCITTSESGCGSLPAIP